MNIFIEFYNDCLETMVPLLNNVELKKADV